MCWFGQSFAQSVSLKAGTTFDPGDGSFASQRIEAVFAYPLSQKFEVSLTSGYYRHHVDQSVFIYPPHTGGGITLPDGTMQEEPAFRIDHAYTIQDIPIVAGIKYNFSHNTAAPYLIMEFGNIYAVGNGDDRSARYGHGSPQDISHGIIIKIGGGLFYKIRDNLLLDFSVKAIHPQDDIESIELMAGVCMQLW
jgi:hypothetical protein